MRRIGLATVMLSGAAAAAAAWAGTGTELGAGIGRQPGGVRAIPRLTAAERQGAIARLVPAYRGTPAGPFAVNPRNPVVPGIVSLTVMGAARAQTSYLSTDPTGSVLLLPNQPGMPRPNVSLALAAHARPYVVDCTILSSEPQVGYHVDALTWGEYDTKAFDARKNTAPVANGHVLIALAPAKTPQRLIIGRPSGDAVPTAFRMFVLFGCEISRLD